MSAPSVKTVKRLFAVSGNRCAFPRCRTALVDVETGKVTGRTCHIKGSLPGSTRYDPNQVDEERHGFDNLLLMCPLHHDVIDADPDSYTVDRLRKIKQEHEASYAGGAEPSDKVADQLIAETLSINGVTIRDGSFIISKNQMGGQVGPTIFNVTSHHQQGGITAGKVDINVQSQSSYIPPSEDIKQEVHKLFDEIHRLFGKKIRFILEVESGNNNRSKVASDLEAMVNNPEMLIYPKGNTYVGRFPDYPITVISHPSNSNLLAHLAESLKIYLTSQWKYDLNKNFTEDSIKIYINGTPLFEKDGKVKIE